MKYSTDEALSEIMKRRKQVVIAREQRACRMLSAFVAITFAGLITIIVALQGENAAESTSSVYGSFLLSQEAGGYVLTALVAFALGVTVTILCLRYKKMKGHKRSETIDDIPDSKNQGGD